jgi:hypothetical protein
MDPSPNGGRVSYTLGTKGAIFGVLPVFEGQGLPHDLNALKTFAAMKIPFSAVYAELARSRKFSAHSLSVRRSRGRRRKGGQNLLSQVLCALTCSSRWATGSFRAAAGLLVGAVCNCALTALHM